MQTAATAGNGGGYVVRDELQLLLCRPKRLFRTSQVAYVVVDLQDSCRIAISVTAQHLQAGNDNLLPLPSFMPQFASPTSFGEEPVTHLFFRVGELRLKQLVRDPAHSFPGCKAIKSFSARTPLYYSIIHVAHEDAREIYKFRVLSQALGEMLLLPFALPSL
jgi:hypothetical protein